MTSKVNILGTEYEIYIKKYNEEEAFERRKIDGYCDSYTRKIVVCDMTTSKGWEKEEPETCQAAQKQILRHEIVHAFLSESGLADCSARYEGAWPRNEEMVDWIALQGPKIYEAWKQAGCL